MNYLQKNVLGLLGLCVMQSVAFGTFNPEYTDLGGHVQISPEIINFGVAASGRFHDMSQKVSDLSQHIQASKTADIVAACKEVGRKITPQIVVDFSDAVVKDSQNVPAFVAERREAMRKASLLVVPANPVVLTAPSVAPAIIDPLQKAPVAQVIFPDITAALKWIAGKGDALFEGAKSQKIIRYGSKYGSESSFSGTNSFEESCDMTRTIYGNEAGAAKETNLPVHVVTPKHLKQIAASEVAKQSLPPSFDTVSGLMKKSYAPRPGFAGVHTQEDIKNIAAVLACKPAALPASSADAGLIGVAHGLADETGVVPFASLVGSEASVVPSQNGVSASLSAQDLVDKMNARSGLLQNQVSNQITDMDLRLTVKETNARLSVVEQANKGIETVNTRLENIEKKLNQPTRFEQVTQYVQENPLKVAAGAVVTVAAVYGVYRLVVYVKELRSEKELLKAQLALQRA